MIDLPSGFTEREVLTTINTVVNTIAPSFVFGYYDLDDIRQEGRIFALEALSRYRKGNLYNFLYTHVRNRLINLRRDKQFRPQLPCQNCVGYAIKCLEYDDKRMCPRYQEWCSLNTSKRDLLTTLEIEDQYSYEENFIDNILKKEIMEYIDKHLDHHLRKDYLIWREGSKLAKGRADKIVEEVKRILSFYYREIYGEET